MNVIEKLRGKRWVRWIGYPLFFNLAFWAALHLTFPYDALRDRIVTEASRASGMKVEIGKVRLAGVSGITLKDVDLSKEGAEFAAAAAAEAAAGGGEGAAPGEGAEAAAAAGAPEGAAAPAPAGPPKIHFDSVTAQADLFSLIRGKRALKFSAEAWGGELDGRMMMGEEESVLEARGSGIDLAKSPLKDLAGLDLVGTLDRLTIDLKSPGPDFSKADGEIAIDGKGLLLNGGEVQHFELPKIAMGELGGKIKVEKGNGTFDKLGLKGDDLEAQIEGTLRLAPVFKQSSLNTKLKIKPSDDWWNKNEMLKTAANFALPADKNGWRVINVYGQIAHPNFRPQK